MKFVIDRKTWRRGGDIGNKFPVYGGTCLLNHKGYMCCLGQIALQCGVSYEDILHLTEPNEIPTAYSECHSVLNDELSQEAISINDSILYSDAEREQMLTKLFSSYGHELEFVS